MRYPIYSPDISPYTSSIQTAIRDGWISSQGDFISKATTKCLELFQTPYVVLVNNGTSATHLLYLSLKFKYQNISTIYVPNYVFVAVWNCALYEYTYDQILVLKTEPTTMNMCVDEQYIRSLQPNSAVVIVHNIGNVVDVPRLKRLRPDLIFVEDCCEAMFETYENSVVGTASLCASISFFANKLITTGEGGLWYTHDKDLYEFIYKSCHHGATNERYIYDVIGYNYRMTNLQAAFLFDQLQDISGILTRKREIRDRYNRLLQDTTYTAATTGLWMFVVRSQTETYEDIQQRLQLCEVDVRPMFFDIHTHSHLRNISAEFQDVDRSRLCMIPSSPNLTAFDQTYIVSCLLGNGAHDIRIASSSSLSQFLSNPMPLFFRYYTQRNVEDCLCKHTLTMLIYEHDIPIAYGHIDDHWIGICVLPSHQRNGIGSYILKFSILYAKACNLSFLRLSVDKENIGAIRLYDTYGFETTDTTDRYYLKYKPIK